MRRERTYFNTKFPADVIFAAANAAKKLGAAHEHRQMIVQVTDDEGWDFETDEEFLAEYGKDIPYAAFTLSNDKTDLSVVFQNSNTEVKIKAADRPGIMKIAHPFEEAVSRARLPAKDQRSAPRVFIGHGRSPVWRDLKDHLHDAHHLPVEAYEVGARAGHTIRDILEDMLSRASVALLVMTGEDLDATGGLHARENVIHELGLFQGKLGFNRAIVLLEQGTHEFSNIHGIQQLRFSKGNIREAFGDVIAVLRREFGNI